MFGTSSTPTGATPHDPKATDPAAWRATCTELAREAREWEAVARNLASCFPDGPSVLRRQMAAHGLTTHPPLVLPLDWAPSAALTIPTDSEGIE